MHEVRLREQAKIPPLVDMNPWQPTVCASLLQVELEDLVQLITRNFDKADVPVACRRGLVLHDVRRHFVYVERDDSRASPVLRPHQYLLQPDAQELGLAEPLGPVRRVLQFHVSPVHPVEPLGRHHRCARASQGPEARRRRRTRCVDQKLCGYGGCGGGWAGRRRRAEADGQEQPPGDGEEGGGWIDHI